MKNSIRLLEERAENYTSEQIGRIDTFDKHLVKNLEGYLFSSAGKGRPCLLLGGKGTGKTLNLIKTLRRGVRELSDFSPVMFIYEKAKRIEQLSSSLLLQQGMDEDRLSNVEGLSQGGALKKADAIVFDDFHYVCEDVERGQHSSEDLINFLKEVLRRVEDGKKVIISSADQLLSYSDIVEDYRFDELLLKYGEGGGSKDSLARMEVSSPTVKKWKEIAKCLGIEAEDIILRFVYECDPNPRKLIRFANLFGGKVTMPELRREASKRMEVATESTRAYDTDFFNTLFMLPNISSRFFSMLDKHRKRREKRKKMSYWMREKDSEKESIDREGEKLIREIHEQRKKIKSIAEKVAKKLAPPGMDEVNKDKWGNDSIYTVSKKYSEGPLGKSVVEKELSKSLMEMDVDNWADIEGDFLSFVQEPDRYDRFLKDLEKIKSISGKNFEEILDNFDGLFERIGGEWFPVEPCKIAFHDILYGSHSTEGSFEFLKGYGRCKSKKGMREFMHEFMDRVIPKFDLPKNVKEEAHEIFKKFYSLNELHGYSAKVFGFASVYLACRKNFLSRSMNDFAKQIPDSVIPRKTRVAKENLLQTKKARIYRAYKKISSELDIDIPLTDSIDYAVRFGEKLGLERETIEKSVKILEKAEDEMNLSGHSPVSVAAGAVYIASIACGERRTQKEVGEAANVNEITLRNNYQLIAEQTDMKVE